MSLRALGLVLAAMGLVLIVAGMGSREHTLHQGVAYALGGWLMILGLGMEFVAAA